MKALLYLVGLIGIGVLIAWLAFGITPENQWHWVRGYAMETSSTISGHLSDTADSASKLKDRLGERFDEASDVYHGVDSVDPFQYNQDPTQK